MIIDVKAEGQSDGSKGAGKKIQMSRKIFAIIEFGSGQNAAVVIDQLKERRLIIGRAEPAMRGSVVLPELADVLHLPAAHRLRFLFVSGIGSQIIFQSPAADGSAVEFEIVVAHFGSRKAVGKRWAGREEFFQESGDEGGPGFAAIASGSFGRPGSGEAGGSGF